MDGAPQPCHYHRLGVSSDATVDEIRSAFRNRALQIHPDKQANSGISPAVATAAFQELNHAYEVLLRFHLSEVDVSQPKQQSSSRYSFHEQNSSACSAYWELGGCSQSSGNEVSTKHARPCYDIGKGVEFTKTRDFAWVEDHDAWPDWKVREFMDDAVMGKMMMKLEKKQKNSSVRDAHKRKKKREVRGMKCQKKDKRTQRVERAAYRMSLKDQKDEKRRFDRSRICYEKPEWMEEEEGEEEIASLSQQWMKRNKWKKHKVKVGELMDALEDEDDGEGRVLFQFNCEMPPEEDEDEDEDEEGIDELCEQTNFDDPYFNKDLSDDDEEDVDAGIEGDKVIERSNKKVIGIVLRRRVKIMRRLN